jgi:hypothetical protein
VHEPRNRQATNVNYFFRTTCRADSVRDDPEPSFARQTLSYGFTARLFGIDPKTPGMTTAGHRKKVDFHTQTIYDDEGSQILDDEPCGLTFGRSAGPRWYVRLGGRFGAGRKPGTGSVCDALEQVARGGFALYVLDGRFGKSAGIDLCERIRASD